MNTTYIVIFKDEPPIPVFGASKYVVFNKLKHLFTEVHSDKKIYLAEEDRVIHPDNFKSDFLILSPFEWSLWINKKIEVQKYSTYNIKDEIEYNNEQLDTHCDLFPLYVPFVILYYSKQNDDITMSVYPVSCNDKEQIFEEIQSIYYDETLPNNIIYNGISLTKFDLRNYNIVILTFEEWVGLEHTRNFDDIYNEYNMFDGKITI